MNPIRKVPKQAVWAQISTVVIWFMITVVEWASNPTTSPGLLIPAVVRATEALSVFLVSGIFMWILENISNGINRPVVRLATLVLLYPGAMAANLISIGIRSLIGYAAPPQDSFFFVHSLHYYIPLFLVLAAYAIVKSQMEILQEKERAHRAETLAQQARWTMLRYQVNPHFLFNALNTIRALIGSDDGNARKVVTELSEYFRYSLTRDKATLVSLEEEMGAARSYLEIQQIRFGDRLTSRFRICPEAGRCMVPVFSVQTLVENAVKYGMKSGLPGVEVEVIAELADRTLRVSVINSGRLFSDGAQTVNNEGSGTGMENLRERLSHLDPDYSLTLEESGGKVVAKLETLATFQES